MYFLWRIHHSFECEQLLVLLVIWRNPNKLSLFPRYASFSKIENRYIHTTITTYAHNVLWNQKILLTGYRSSVTTSCNLSVFLLKNRERKRISKNKIYANTNYHYSLCQQSVSVDVNFLSNISRKVFCIKFRLYFSYCPSCSQWLCKDFTCYRVLPWHLPRFL